jgi:DNA repair exonuclease SbcCD nuclease subunit
VPEKGSRGDILAGHLEVQGGIMNATGIKSLDGIKARDLVGYKFVFLGHYHEPQEFRVPGASYAGYIGSVMQTDLSLSQRPRGITFLQGGLPYFREIPSPKMLTAKVTTQEEANNVIGSLNDGNYWRITVTDPGVSMPAFDHRIQIEYDIKPKAEARLEERPGEDLKETVTRFIDTVETKVDKELAKLITEEVMQ